MPEFKDGPFYIMSLTTKPRVATYTNTGIAWANDIVTAEDVIKQHMTVPAEFHKPCGPFTLVELRKEVDLSSAEEADLNREGVLIV